MVYKVNRIYSKNRLEYFIILSGNVEIPFYVSKNEILYDWWYDKKLNGCREVTIKDVPLWVIGKIDCLFNLKEQAEIKFEYFENGFWKKDVDYLDFNFVKGDEGFHEEAIRIFKETNSTKYEKINIISVGFC